MDDFDLDEDDDNDAQDEEVVQDDDGKPSVDFGHWPELFVTRIIGPEDLPDVEILTLPASEWPTAILELRSLQTLLLTGLTEEFPIVGGSDIDNAGMDACHAALHQVIIDAGLRQGLPWSPKRTQTYAREIFQSYPVPLMNSPLSGSSLMQMVTAAGSGAAFMAVFPHPDLGQVTLYFLMIGATRIILGAADGISIGLKQGLSQVILRWMGVPKSIASPKKRKAAR